MSSKPRFPVEIPAFVLETVPRSCRRRVQAALPELVQEALGAGAPVRDGVVVVEVPKGRANWPFPLVVKLRPAFPAWAVTALEVPPRGEAADRKHRPPSRDKRSG